MMMASIDTCQVCGRSITSEESAKHWPIISLDGQLTCSSCYGDDAYCSVCGSLLDGSTGFSTCENCETKQ